MAAKLALFIDVESIHGRLRSLHHRILDPGLLVETAREQGEITKAVAVGDWGALPQGFSERFAAQEIEIVQVDRLTRGRESGGRRRDVLRDLVDVLAQMVETLLGDGDLDGVVVACGDETSVRAIRLVRERFEKDVHVVGVEGALGEALEEAACSCTPLPMPPVEAQDREGLSKMVPMLEALEAKKRYLNFKYIRESVVRKIELSEKSFEAAEVLLSDAIACGLLLKIKVEDKYNEGQLFTAYALNRENPLFEEFGSGEPAPTHDESESEPAVPTLSRRRKEPPRKEAEPAAAAQVETREERDDSEPGEKKRRRRGRRRGKGAERRPEPEPEPAPAQIAASTPRGKKKRRGRTSNNHQQDRVGRSYEAPSRFLSDDSQEGQFLEDHEVDEDMILQARGDND